MITDKIPGYYTLICHDPCEHLLRSATNVASLDPTDPECLDFELLLKEHIKTITANDVTYRIDDDIGQVIYRDECESTPQTTRLRELVEIHRLTLPAAEYRLRQEQYLERKARKTNWIATQSTGANALSSATAEQLYHAGQFSQEVDWRVVAARVLAAPAHWHPRLIAAIQSRFRDECEEAVAELFSDTVIPGRPLSRPRYMNWSRYTLEYIYME